MEQKIINQEAYNRIKQELKEAFAFNDSESRKMAISMVVSDINHSDLPIEIKERLLGYLNY
jgi:hypothetical protein